MKSDNKIDLIAPCGLNCGLCWAYGRAKNPCPGCRAPDDRKAVSVLRCKIKACEELKKQMAFCFTCASYPCANIKRLDKRYGTRYGTSPMENLESIRQAGIERFVEDEGKKWACPRCGGSICMHTGCCRQCGGRKA